MMVIIEMMMIMFAWNKDDNDDDSDKDSFKLLVQNHYITKTETHSWTSETETEIVNSCLWSLNNFNFGPKMRSPVANRPFLKKDAHPKDKNFSKNKTDWGNDEKEWQKIPSEMEVAPRSN